MSTTAKPSLKTRHLSATGIKPIKISKTTRQIKTLKKTKDIDRDRQNQRHKLKPILVTHPTKTNKSIKFLHNLLLNSPQESVWTLKTSENSYPSNQIHIWTKEKKEALTFWFSKKKSMAFETSGCKQQHPLLNFSNQSQLWILWV